MTGVAESQPDPTDRTDRTERSTRARMALAAVTDPELPDLSIDELGVLRSVEEHEGTVVVTVTPTFSGCPAMAEILGAADRALAAAGVAPYRIETRLSPAWSSAWITATGRDKLQRAGIAPPPGGPHTEPRRGPRDGPVDVVVGGPPASVACPRCGAAATVLLSDFAATACRSLRRCEVCREPFDAVKAV